MKIGIDLTFIKADHKNGGTESVMKNLIKGFEELKAEKDSIMDDMEFVYFIHEDIYDEYRGFFPHANFHVYNMSGKHAIRMVLFQTFKLKKLVKEEKCDLLYFPTFQSGLKTNWKLPIIVSPNDIQYKYYPEYFSKGKRIYYQIFYKNSLKKSDAIVNISNYTKECFDEYFKAEVQDKIEVLYVPIDFALLETKAEKTPCECIEAMKNMGNMEDADGEFILCINSLTKHKNLITLVKAYHLLYEECANIPKLVIGGAKWNGANELSEYIATHHLENQVVLTGYLTDEQIQSLYQHARLFVTPSLYEGFGMTPIEAMVADCPVISTKETSLYEVTMGLVRYYEPASDEKALCGAIKKELAIDYSLDENKEILAKRHEAVKRYDIKTISKAYVDLFVKTYQKYRK